MLFVTAAPVFEHLVAGVDHLDGPARLVTQQRRADIQRRRCGFGAESATNSRPDHPYLPERYVQHVRHHVLHVRHYLRRGVQNERAIMFPSGNRGVWLQRRLVHVVANKNFFAHVVRLGKRLFDIAEFLFYERIDVVLVFFVDQWRAFCYRFHRIEQDRQLFELHIDQGKRLFRSLFIDSCHRSNWIADVTNLLFGKNVFVITRGRYAVFGIGYVGAGQYREYSRQCLCLRNVDFLYKAMRDR